ncbi:hydrolase [Burkholderia phage BcepSauron]|uniref:Hydrolase n=1 Tax=Burkholderia phage BcepSauron TaxID=2530033 RepID=A0A482MKE6_9CAUD|nr:MutT/NUDIX hydrolase [Burkholderia phage BcepSauron]QBQ74511.1 hydrolase [Burkholderia phage BcepSauron]
MTIPKHIAGVACVLIDKGTGDVLLQRRIKDPGSDFFVLPGGVIEEGEDPKAAIIREMREEVGVELRETDPMAMHFASDTHVSGDKLIMMYYAAVIDREAPVNREPHKCAGIFWSTNPMIDMIDHGKYWNNDMAAIARCIGVRNAYSGALEQDS